MAISALVLNSYNSCKIEWIQLANMEIYIVLGLSRWTTSQNLIDLESEQRFFSCLYQISIGIQQGGPGHSGIIQ